jgi:hypothetical protein
MKWMKIRDNLPNTMSKKVQHCVESQLIEVMKMKMQWIQFGLIVNEIQMKSMKVIHTRENMMSQEFQHCAES